MSIDLLEVTDTKSLCRFIEVANRVNRSNPHWIPPLTLERRMTFSAKHNAFLRRAETRFWIATRGGQDVGRISAQIDPLGNSLRSAPQCHFGCLSAIDDAAVFARLLGAVEAFAKERNMADIAGPFTFSINEETGLLVDGFETPPMLMMGHDPAYCDDRLHALGYAKAKDMLAYDIDLEKPLSSAASKMLERPLARGVSIRPIDFSDYRNEIGRIVDIYNDAWRTNWGFVPLTEEETEEMAARLKPLLNRHFVQFAYMDGECVAFMVALPNLNEAIRDLNGKLFPFGWAKLLWRLKVTGLTSARVALMGVKGHVSGTIAGSALPLQLIWAAWPHARKIGVRQVELSWILEDNLPMRRVLDRLGADAYKTYRIYTKAVA